MKKRLLPILLTLVLVCELPLGAVFVTSGDVTSALVSAAWADTAEGEGSAGGEGGSGTTEVTFRSVSNESDLRTAIGNGQSVKLMGDIGISSALEVKSSLTLDLNGRVLSRVNPSSALKANFSMIQVMGNATLTLVDSGSTAVHKFSTGGQRWEKVSDNASGENIATVEGGVIYGDVDSHTEDVSGIKIISGTLEMYGGNIVGVRSVYSTCYGGGVYVSDKCTFNMHGGSIKGCYVFDDGGGVYVAAGGTFTMSGSSTIEGCNASSGSGVYNAGTFTMSGNSCITDCIYRSSVGSGGVHNAGTFNLNGGSIVRSLSGYNNNKELYGIYNGGVLNAMVPVGCWVNNCSTISRGVFTVHVYNHDGGEISGGEFQGEVNNYAKITGGEFTAGTVESLGTITGGNFHVEVINRNGGRIGGGTFNKTVTNKDAGVIGNDHVGYNGVFKGNVTNSNYSTINGGTFYGNVTNSDNAILNGGTFYGTVTGENIDKAYETVTFDSKGGTVVDSQRVLRGQKATKPATPTKAGYIFNDWFAEGAATAFDFTTPITTSLTLTAKWELCGHAGSTAKATCAATETCTVCQGTIPKDANNHTDLTRVDAAAATTKAEGNIEYWHCTGCGRYFSDAQAAEEITQADTVLAKLPPRYYYNSGTAAKPDSGKKNSPGTADPGVMLYGAAALLSLTGMAVLTGKKK